MLTVYLLSQAIFTARMPSFGLHLPHGVSANWQDTLSHPSLMIYVS
jgi:hypothetical protein